MVQEVELVPVLFSGRRQLRKSPGRHVRVAAAVLEVEAHTLSHACGRNFGLVSGQEIGLSIVQRLKKDKNTLDNQG